ncbi:MAG: tetratricopeptide repeat protein, partial [Myxococcales bacterium]|nr:tetratricopeptide repeat protein [Myxococcales bacterium]
AFELGDLDRSIAASRASVATASDRPLKAASLYNLGRALEQQGDADGAAEAYLASFELRPNKTVQDRLAAVGAAPPATLVAPTPVAGPFASVAAYCKAWRARQSIAPDADPDGIGCGADVRPYTEPYERAIAAPFDDVVYFAEEVDYVWTYRVAMKTRAGWFISPPTWTRDANTDYGELERLVVGQPDATGDGMLSIAWQFTYDERDREAEVSPYETSRYLVVCGADAAGAVRCTPTLQVASDVGGDGVTPVAWTVQVTLAPGSITLASAAPQLGAHVRPLLGTHPLAFR